MAVEKADREFKEAVESKKTENRAIRRTVIQRIRSCVGFKQEKIRSPETSRSFALLLPSSRVSTRVSIKICIDYDPQKYSYIYHGQILDVYILCVI